MRVESLMSIREGARFCRVKPVTLYRMVRAGKVPFHRVGRLIRLERADLLAATRQTTSAKAEHTA